MGGGADELIISYMHMLSIYGKWIYCLYCLDITALSRGVVSPMYTLTCG